MTKEEAIKFFKDHEFLGVSNLNVNISGPFMYLLDTNREEIELHLLDSMNIEEHIK